MEFCRFLCSVKFAVRFAVSNQFTSTSRSPCSTFFYDDIK